MNLFLVFRECESKIDLYELECPPLFLSEDIDRTALIYFNHSDEVRYLGLLMISMTLLSGKKINWIASLNKFWMQ